MKLNLLGTLLAVVFLSSAAFAASDLECTLDQNPQAASGNIAALLSRGYLALGHKYISDGGGIDGDNKAVYSEHMLLGNHMRLTHTVINGTDSTYALSADESANMNDQQIFEALLKVSAVASQKLSADDAAALQNCDHLLGQYIGVSPQPDHP
jgi:hypothetical protein